MLHSSTTRRHLHSATAVSMTAIFSGMGVHLTTTAINRVAKNLELKVKCAEAGVCGQVRPPPPPITRRSDKHDNINFKNDDDTERRPEPQRPRPPGGKLADVKRKRGNSNSNYKKYDDTERRPEPRRPRPPGGKLADVKRKRSNSNSNYKKDDDTVRRPEPRRPRHVHNDEEGWQTVRRQPRRRGPSYSHFCGEGGHVKDNCRHEHRFECHSSGQLGHKEKFCAYY